MSENNEHWNVTIGEAYQEKRIQLEGLINDLAKMIMQSDSSTFHNCEKYLSERIKDQVSECEKIQQLGRTIVFWREHKSKQCDAE